MGGGDAGIQHGDGISIISPQSIEPCQERVSFIYWQIQQLFAVHQLPRFRICEFEEEILQCSQGQTRLDIVGPIEAVETVGPEDPPLQAAHLSSLQIDAGESHGFDDGLQFVNELLGVVEFVALALLVEIVELVAQGKVAGLAVHHLFVEVAELSFVAFAVAEQVDGKDAAVDVLEGSEVALVGGAGEGGGAFDDHVAGNTVDTFLGEEGWHAEWVGSYLPLICSCVKSRSPRTASCSVSTKLATFPSSSIPRE